MHKILEDPIPVPEKPVTAGDCFCTCKKHVTGMNQEVAADDSAETGAEVSVDIEDPPG